MWMTNSKSTKTLKSNDPKTEINQDVDNYLEQVNGRMSGEDLETASVWWEGN